MDTVGDLLAKKAFETFRDSRASKIKGRYYWRHTCNEEGKSSARCSRLKASGKPVETLGNTSPKVKRFKHCSRHWVD